MKKNKIERTNINRRTFLKSTGTTVIGSTTALSLGFPNIAFAKRDNTLRIGLVGCGGRGTGAANQALNADPNVVLYAVADIFEDRINDSLSALEKIHGRKVQVDKSRRFIGFDAYQKVIDSVDVVLLATTPVFRPTELAACVDAGKHVFYEKPVAVDAPGVRTVKAAAKKAKEKNLTLVCGLCFRYNSVNQAIYEKVLNGAIGDIKVVSAIRYGGPWHEPVRQPGWTDMEYQIRFWYYHNWLSGDFNVEQFVHSMDQISWVLGEKVPIRAIGTGGRQERTAKQYGNIYDHFATSFEYEDGVRAFANTRQQKGASGQNTVEVFGTKGNAYYSGNVQKITGENNWSFQGEKNDMYQEEHNVFFDSIRHGKGINDGERAANSTMMAILQRMVGYSGKIITWDEAINSDQVLGPKVYSRDLKYIGSDVAIPGVTNVLI
ncbi:MAG: Gfo/Idh/MocA family oxidoreductase [Chitinophagaceae bacterium]|nr:Gfo/Idh/MocA family oxidoreductase [Chitinophagaceae bacterium]